MTFWRRDKTGVETFSVGADEFRALCGCWPTGVSVVTTRTASGAAYGVTMNSVTSVSLEPPLLLICLTNDSDTLAAMRESGIFCINVLTSAQTDLSQRFAYRRADKFQDVAVHDGRLGVPVLDGALAALECRVEEVYPGGDHKIVVGELVHGVCYDDEAAPLVYFKGQYASLS